MNLLRVSSERPCPICGRPKWCSVSDDGAWAICMKEPSERPTRNGVGWLHRLTPEKRNGHADVKQNGASPTMRYEIRGLGSGELVAAHCRRDLPGGDKRLWWERPDGSKGLGGHKPTELPLYRTETLVALAEQAVVFVCEGEKAADALTTLGVHVVGTVTGADTIPDDDVLATLVGYDVVLWPDNDEPGRRHMIRIAGRLQSMHVDPRVLTWPDAPPKGDAADFVAGGLGKEELRALYRDAVVLEPTPEPTPNGVVEYRLADLTPEDVHWLWPGRVAYAKITVLDGDPGLGKSTVTLDIAARLTRGDRMPDGAIGDHEGPGAVLLLTAEDGLRDTVLPRLTALGANLDLVFALESVTDERGEPTMPAIPRDLAVLEERIVVHDVKLVIVDPLIAFLGDSSETNTWRDQDIRRALGPFALMLERRGCAALLVRHLNKGSGGNPIYRGGGSIGIIGAARSGLLIAKDNEDDTGRRRVMVPTKANLSAPASALAYHMEQAPNGSVMVVWEGETEHTAMGLLADPLPEDERGALADAVDFLKSELYGDPVLVSEIRRKAREADISTRTLTRARAKLHVVACRVHGPTGPWSLRLPVLPGTKAAEQHGADA